MQTNNGLLNQVINIDENQFESVALKVFQSQYQNNLVYHRFIDSLQLDTTKVSGLHEIPFLPIELFKTQKVVTGIWEPELIFTSSGTGNQVASNHYLPSAADYKGISEEIFSSFYGSAERYHILALLPSYLERTGSSLVYMLENLVDLSQSVYSGFYLHNHDRLVAQIEKVKQEDQRRLMLWGVSFALLDLAETTTIDLSDAIIIETGGMKGRREEIIREDLHQRLISSFNCKEIQSEYGMAELTSQAYTVNGRFHTPPWMHVMVRDISDPFHYLPAGQVGALNIIDLANGHSCAFIETQDLGEVGDDGSFTVLGRLDNSEVRGCNLLV